MARKSKTYRWARRYHARRVNKMVWRSLPREKHTNGEVFVWPPELIRPQAGYASTKAV